MKIYLLQISMGETAEKLEELLDMVFPITIFLGIVMAFILSLPKIFRFFSKDPIEEIIAGGYVFRIGNNGDYYYIEYSTESLSWKALSDRFIDVDEAHARIAELKSIETA